MYAQVVALLVTFVTPPVVADPPKPLPLSAHNCYPQDGQGTGRLAEALALGIDNIEIDLGWDEPGRKLIVGHDAAPRPGVAYPEFEAYVLPALEAHWRTPRADGAPTVLTLDFKTDHPAAIERLKAFLDAHADWFSSAPKAEESPLTVRKLTVCLTGSETAKQRYDALVPAGGLYRAFRDTVYGAGGYHPDISTYAPAPATAYHRFLAFHWGHIERGIPAVAGAWTADDAARLKGLVDRSHRRGYRVRFYCLNGHTGPHNGPYRFVDDAAARLRWRAAAEAGVDWVATDEYADAARELAKIGPRPE